MCPSKDNVKDAESPNSVMMSSWFFCLFSTPPIRTCSPSANLEGRQVKDRWGSRLKPSRNKYSDSGYVDSAAQFRAHVTVTLKTWNRTKCSLKDFPSEERPCFWGDIFPAQALRLVRMLGAGGKRLKVSVGMCVFLLAEFNAALCQQESNLRCGAAVSL